MLRPYTSLPTSLHVERGAQQSRGERLRRRKRRQAHGNNHSQAGS